jgi:5-methylcytosine-specific restriction endonuclease McrA
MLKCLNCQTILSGKYQLKFCSHSCSASYTNRQKIKHGKYAEKQCIVCSSLTTNPKFCSKSCSGQHRKKYNTAEEKLDARRINLRETNANYRAKLLSQTPIDADRKAIKEFYSNCPDGYEVDHIIPISKGGLHTLSNLQYLTISENRRKSNKLA